ncbi:hypothetical protein DB346_10555 [Verrucomicrobia bacterium LW23]|nr:hypothetical protein DB346_10555 [Verrucomicrobia bacterium LW23]
MTLSSDEIWAILVVVVCGYAFLAIYVLWRAFNYCVLKRGGFNGLDIVAVVLFSLLTTQLEHVGNSIEDWLRPKPIGVEQLAAGSSLKLAGARLLAATHREANGINRYWACVEVPEANLERFVSANRLTLRQGELDSNHIDTYSIDDKKVAEAAVTMLARHVVLNPGAATWLEKDRSLPRFRTIAAMWTGKSTLFGIVKKTDDSPGGNRVYMEIRFSETRQ